MAHGLQSNRKSKVTEADFKSPPSSPVVSRERGGDGVGGGDLVVSRCSTTGYRLAPLPGGDFVGRGFRWCRSWSRSTTGFKRSSLRDEEVRSEK